jgi:aminoglycoside phosphotransferase family enzyme
MATRLQITQLGFVTNIRETRFQRLLSEAIVAVEVAEAELKAADKMLLRRHNDAKAAEIDFAKTPGNEMSRIWRDVCAERRAIAEAALDSAKVDRDEAETQLTTARNNVLRIKERGNRITDIGKTLRRSEIRQAEARLEDDIPAKRANLLILESNG